MENLIFLDTVVHVCLILCGVIAFVCYRDEKDIGYATIAFIGLLVGIGIFLRELLWLI